jgi:hypothetical protein
MAFAIGLMLTRAESALADKPVIKTGQVFLINPTKSSRILLLGENFQGATKDSMTITLKDTNKTFKIQKVKLVTEGIIIRLKAPEGFGDIDDGDEITVTVINETGESDTEDASVVSDDEV